MSRVRIGTCSGPADAALVRAMYSARGIGVVVGAENHSSMLGGLGGGFLSLDIWVDDEDAEEAALLLHDLRERGSLDDDREDDDDDDFDLLDDRTAGMEGSEERRGGDRAGARAIARTDTTAEFVLPVAREDSSGLELDTLSYRIDRRRRTGMVMLLGGCITFGTAHMFTRAWLRGVALGAVEIVGILQVAGGNRAGAVAIVGAVAADVIGAAWRVWATPAQTLPRARLHRR